MSRPVLDALERLEFLSSSPNRYRLLDALVDDAATPTELGERLEIPRSTLRRNLAALERRGYVSRLPSENRYECTTVGATVRDAFGKALERIERADSLVPFFEDFPADLPSSIEFESCEVVVSTTDGPYEPVSRVRRTLEGSSRARGFLPTINPVYVDPLCECADRGLTIELIAPEAAYEAVQSARPDAVEKFESIPEIHLFQSPSVPEYALGWIDDELVLGAFDANMRTQSVLFVSDPSVDEWALERYETVQASGTRVG